MITAAAAAAAAAAVNMLQANRREWPHLLFWETPAKHEVASSGDKCQPAIGGCFKC
jgi:hypothetical protein